MNDAANSPARNTKVMNRFDLTSRLVAKLKNEEAVIGGIGNTNFDLWGAGHRPQNFYMLGSMGLNTNGSLYGYRSSKAAVNAIMKSMSTL